MKSRLPLLLLIAGAQAQAPATPKAEPHYFRFLRTIEVPSGSSAQACAVLDPAIFAQALPTLADLRLYSGANEVPYAITISESTLQPPDAARVLNLGLRDRNISFDLEMPARSYTEVDLSLAGADFLATAKVTGLKSAQNPSSTALGTFTLFDLTSQHLSRSTSLPLQESSFPLLHVDLTSHPDRGIELRRHPRHGPGCGGSAHPGGADPLHSGRANHSLRTARQRDGRSRRHACAHSH